MSDQDIADVALTMMVLCMSLVLGMLIASYFMPDRAALVAAQCSVLAGIVGLALMIWATLQ